MKKLKWRCDPKPIVIPNGVTEIKGKWYMNGHELKRRRTPCEGRKYIEKLEAKLAKAIEVIADFGDAYQSDVSGILKELRD